MDDADRRDLERRVGQLEAVVAKLPRQIPFYGGGGGRGVITYATKGEADAAAAGLTPGVLCYVTALDRYYHLLAAKTWQAWSFLE